MDRFGAVFVRLLIYFFKKNTESTGEKKGDLSSMMHVWTWEIPGLTSIKQQKINWIIFYLQTNLSLAKKVFPSNFAVFDQVWSQILSNLKPDFKSSRNNLFQFFIRSPFGWCWFVFYSLAWNICQNFSILLFGRVPKKVWPSLDMIKKALVVMWIA